MHCHFKIEKQLTIIAKPGIWTVLSYEGQFSWKRYLAAAGTAIPFTATYAVSNIFFLLVLAKPIGEKLSRIKIKYGILE